MTILKAKKIIILGTIWLLTLTSLYAHSFDTLLVLSAPKPGSAIRVHDIYIENKKTVILYDIDKELFVYRSDYNGTNFRLNARLAGEKGDRVSTSSSYQVKQPTLCQKGDLVIAASDLDQDGQGGRFLRWNTLKQKRLEDLATGQWGIGNWAVSTDGRYFINYYFKRPGNKIPVFDAEKGTTQHIKTRYILYADSIFFTDNNKKLVFISAYQNNTFRNVVFSFPDLQILQENYFMKQDNCQIKNDLIYCIENDKLSIKSSSSEQTFYFEGELRLWKNTDSNELFLIVSNKYRVYILNIGI